MQHIGLILVERVQSTDRQNSKEQGWRHLGRLERLWMQERQVVVKQSEVTGQEIVYVFPALQTKGWLHGTLAVHIFDVLHHGVVLVVGPELWCLGHGESLARARRSAIVDGRYWTDEEGKRRETSTPIRRRRTRDGKRAVHRLKRGGQGLARRGEAFYHGQVLCLWLESACTIEGELRQLRILRSRNT